jgi:hypothetical protein
MKVFEECENNPVIQKLRMEQIMEEHKRIVNRQIALETQRIDKELAEIMKRINEAR